MGFFQIVRAFNISYSLREIILLTIILKNELQNHEKQFFQETKLRELTVPSSINTV
jgi:hypothetical protein